MTLAIDLAQHLAEVKAFNNLASTFVDKKSANTLDSLVRTLELGIGQGRETWTWQTDHPIEFGPSTSYDAKGKSMPKTWACLTFKCVFERPSEQRRKPDSVWRIDNSSVHVKMAREDQDFLSCHFDYKNASQWGPQLHVQLAEGDHRFPIPRLPSSIFLPTDCADLILSELMPEAWERHQRRGSASADVSMLRRAQEQRAMSMVGDIKGQWAKDNRTTRVSMLQSYSPTVKGLPNHLGTIPVPSWQ